MRQKSIIITLIALLGLFTLGCGSKPDPEANQEGLAPQAEVVVAAPTAAPAEVKVDPPARPEVIVEAETKAEETVEADRSTANLPAAAEVETVEEVMGVQPAVTSPDSNDEAAGAESSEPVPFTATTGLDTFAAYHMQFVMDFDGTRQNQPTAGQLAGLVEVTQEPKAQHWQMEMDGGVFGQLAALGTMELYDIGNVIYIQNPQDKSWIGVPAELVKSMLPMEMYKPEDNIDLPVTAASQPGEEEINGVMTRRYTFGPEDLAGDGSTYDQVEGTIWVAVDGNYVVKYESTISGQFANLSTGGMKLMDEGTITMMYNVSDVNGDFTINPPAGAKGLDLGGLLSGLGNLR